MTPIPVSSRLIKSVHFSETDKRLVLLFHDGQGRMFENVTREAVTEMVEAPSPGQHYIERFRHEFRRAA